MNEAESNKILRTCISLKPRDLIISDLKWRYLVRAVLRSKNVMIVGPSGCAKTTAARMVAKALNRPFDVYNFGSSQDARATLIGNTSYKKEIGTIFHKSSFVNSITTPNTIVLLDEFSRGTHDAHNIILPVIDPIQRTLRLDEHESGAVIKVADGVSFIATSNVGNEYTATRVLDRAIIRRFPIKIEMPPLNAKELRTLFSIRFTQIPNEKIKLFDVLSDLYEDFIEQCKLEDSPISTIISPANMLEIGELLMDGFNLEEVAEVSIYPEYPDDGGSDSERSFVKSILQKYIEKDVKSPINDPRKNKGLKNLMTS